jgi:hypothetical protein
MTLLWEEAKGVALHAGLMDLKMEMGAGRISGASYFTNCLTLSYGVADFHVVDFQMGIERLQPITMVNNHHASIARVVPTSGDYIA